MIYKLDIVMRVISKIKKFFNKDIKSRWFIVYACSCGWENRYKCNDVCPVCGRYHWEEYGADSYVVRYRAPLWKVFLFIEEFEGRSERDSKWLKDNGYGK